MKVNTALVSFFCMLISTQLVSQQMRQIKPMFTKAQPHEASDDFVVSKHNNPDGTIDLIKVYLPKGEKPYTRYEERDKSNKLIAVYKVNTLYFSKEKKYISFEEFQTYKGNYIFYKLLSGGSSIDTLLIIPPKGQNSLSKIPAVKLEGTVLPEMEFKGLNGEVFSLDALKSKAPYTLLYFWGTWCLGCKQQLPELQKLTEGLHGKLEVLGLNVGDDDQKINAYVSRNKIKWSNVYASPDHIKGLQATAYPYYILLTQGGQVQIVSGEIQPILKYFQDLGQ